MILLFYSLNIVTDNQGGIQLYLSKRDQDWVDDNNFAHFASGPAEENSPSEALIFGASVACGAIEGSEFRKPFEDGGGTNAFGGKSIDDGYGVLFLGGDRYVFANPETGQTDPDKLTGMDISLSWGAPFSYLHLAVDAKPLTQRYQMLPSIVKFGKEAGLFGSYPGWLE